MAVTPDALEFRIHGMDCAEEVAVLKRELTPAIHDPDRLRFDVLRGKMIVAAGSGAWFVAPKAWLAVKRLRPDMNLLMAVIANALRLRSVRAGALAKVTVSGDQP